MIEWCDDCDAEIEPTPEGAAWFYAPDPSSVMFAPAGEPLDSAQWKSLGWIAEDGIPDGWMGSETFIPPEGYGPTAREDSFTIELLDINQEVFDLMFGHISKKQWRIIRGLERKQLLYKGGKP